MLKKNIWEQNFWNINLLFWFLSTKQIVLKLIFRFVKFLVLIPSYTLGLNGIVLIRVSKFCGLVLIQSSSIPDFVA